MIFFVYSHGFVSRTQGQGKAENNAILRRENFLYIEILQLFLQLFETLFERVLIS